MKKENLINRPADALPLIKGYAPKRQEHFGIICLDSGHRVIRRKVLFIGGDMTCNVPARPVMWEACRAGAAGVILFHNHPSGDCTVSPQDRKTTKDLAEGFNVLGIGLLDHIIVGNPWGREVNYFSFFEHGLIENSKDGAFLNVAD